jgi:hypothetical protein
MTRIRRETVAAPKIPATTTQTRKKVVASSCPDASDDSLMVTRDY